MKTWRRGFTLIELLFVVAVLAVLAAILLPGLSAARKRAFRSSLGADAAQAVAPAPARAETVRPGILMPPVRPLATVRSFEAAVSLKPALSVGTADPESIYTARLTAKFEALNPAGEGECEVLLPLPPQIISLADLEVTVNSQPSESVQIRDNKLVWTGSLPAKPTPMSAACTAVGKGLYHLELPPTGILESFHLDLTAVGSDVRMLELSLQPTRYIRANGQTVYTWDYKRLLFGRPVALDVLGIAPIDRLGELTWLAPASVVVFGLLLGLIAGAFRLQNIDRWMLLLILGTFTGAYPLMYFAQEFIPLNAAILSSSALVLAILGVRAVTITRARTALLGVVTPAAAMLLLTLLAALHPRLQGILITATALALFIVAMLLMPRLKPGNAFLHVPRPVTTNP